MPTNRDVCGDGKEINRKERKKKENVPIVVPAECKTYFKPDFSTRRWISAISFETDAELVPICHPQSHSGQRSIHDFVSWPCAYSYLLYSPPHTVYPYKGAGNIDERRKKRNDEPESDRNLPDNVAEFGWTQ
jgi:hypothetical protein